jgi:hypothetical protein
MTRKTIDITERDYDRLIMRAGHPDKIKFIITNLLDLSDQAAQDIRKWAAWVKAVEGTGAKMPPE